MGLDWEGTINQKRKKKTGEKKEKEKKIANILIMTYILKCIRAAANRCESGGLISYFHFLSRYH
jgi:hypothetical protein